MPETLQNCRQRRVRGWRGMLVTALVVSTSIPVRAQTFASLQGRIFDPLGALVPGAVIRVQDESSGFDVSVRADSEARYYVFAIPAGTVHGHGEGVRDFAPKSSRR